MAFRRDQAVWVGVLLALVFTPVGSASGPDPRAIELRGVSSGIPTALQPSGSLEGDATLAIAAPPGTVLIATASQISGTLELTEKKYHRVLDQRVPDSYGSRPVAIDGQALRIAALRAEPSVAWKLGETTTRPTLESERVGALAPSTRPAIAFPFVRAGGTFSGAADSPERLTVPAGTWSGTVAGLNYSGWAEFYAWDASIAWTDGSGPQRVDSGLESRDAASGLSARETERYVHFSGHVAGLRLDGDGAHPAWWADVAIPLAEQRIAFASFTGELSHGGRTYAVQDALVEFQSNGSTLRLGRGEGTAFPVAFSGVSHAVYVDGVLLSSVTVVPGAGRAAAAGVTAAALVLGLAWFLREAVPWSALLSRRTRVTGYAAYVDRTLVNPLRRQTFDLIRSRPGIQAYHVWKAVGGAMGVTLRNLARLEKTGFVRSLHLGRFRHYYPSGVPIEPETYRLAVLATRAAGQTYLMLAEMGPARQADLARALGISGAAASLRIRKLQEFGLVERVGTGSRGYYRALPAKVPPEFFAVAPRTYEMFGGRAGPTATGSTFGAEAAAPGAA